MEQYEPPAPREETPDPVNILLPQSLTPSPPMREATPIIPVPWNRSPTPEDIPLPPIQPWVKKHIGPSSLDLIPLPWDIPPFKETTPRVSPPVASSSFLPEEPMPFPVEPQPEFPLIVSMTPSRTTPLLPKNPLTESEPSSNRPTPPEWKQVQSLPVTGKQKELSPKTKSSPPIASSSWLPRIPPIQTTLLPKHPLMEDEPLVNREGPPSWSSKQPSPITGKQRELPRHVAMC